MDISLADTKGDTKMWFILEKINSAWRIVNINEPIATEHEARDRVIGVLKRDSSREFTLAEMRSTISAETVINEVRL